MNATRCLTHLAIAVCCGAGVTACSSSSPPDAGFIQHAALRLDPRVLDDYAGVYRLPSGALFPVVRVGDFLLGGTPPHELLPQTTRRFASNRLPGELHFERDPAGRVQRLRLCLAKHDYWAERVAPAATTDPATLVDIDGHCLRFLVTGAGRPTIVLEDGFGNGIEQQAILQAALAGISTVVTYDHAGTGGSAPGPEPRDGRQVARELRHALQQAAIPPPYLLVGGSIGGDYIRIFAHEFPRDVAGLVLLDPTPPWEELLAWATIHAPERVEEYRQFVATARRAMAEIMQQQEPGRQAEWSALAATRQQAQHSFPLPDIPIVQITGAAGNQVHRIMHDKTRFFDGWLKQKLPGARHVLAPHSAHAVPITDTSLVLEEVQRVVVQWRSCAGKP